ncbi:MAG TPA: CD225/dispanin family protein [Phycisphaerales bacterium]|nr:CD225/dispanin family protein [Phycisphaerales bacterium]
MNCPKCGALVTPGAAFCANCGSSLAGAPPVQPGQAAYATFGQRPEPPASYLWFSIVVTLLCCMPFGIVGIVYSAMAMSENSNGNYNKAYANSRKALMWDWISFGLGLAWIIPYVVLMIIGGVAGAAGAAGAAGGRGP